jgi:hypothetical protein
MTAAHPARPRTRAGRAVGGTAALPLRDPAGNRRDRTAAEWCERRHLRLGRRAGTGHGALDDNQADGPPGSFRA